MKILQVIHGYPMRYNAGSEVYTQTLAHGLAARHEVHVFTREENSFALDYELRREADPDDERVTVHLVNNARSRDRYRDIGIDRRFADLLDGIRPEIVHIGHLNHLSTSLVAEAAARSIPIVFTLHDFWLMCPRGQFMQMMPADPLDLWAACDGQDDRKCAERCYARYFSGADEEREDDVAYWQGWVGRRMAHVREVVRVIDLFIAPSRHLYRRSRDELGIPPEKLVYLDYGFDLSRLTGRVRDPGEPFTFGYIGTHIPAKGIHHLLDAFGRVAGSPRLRVWGRPRGQDTEALRAIASTLPGDASDRVEWVSEYRNQDIVRDVFNRVDCIVVPSIWTENSPLVIHEALQARVPVITANVGGMAEYIHHEVNGLLFEHRSPAALSVQMQRVVDDPELARRLASRGYLQSANGDIPGVQAHVDAIEALYEGLVAHRRAGAVSRGPGPWRITFDTNPDTCNLRCVMCEEHSPHSPLQLQRRAAGKPRRVMPLELIRRIVAEAVTHGLREIIPSTMGEPLLYEHFDEILALCQEHEVKLNLTTNGTFPRLGAREWARRIVPVASDVKISWNGARAETHEAIMLGTRWDEVVDNVRAFVAVRDDHAAAGGNRCRMTFQLTFLETNTGELADVVRLAVELGIDRVKGHHVWAHFAQLQEQSMRRNPDAIARWNTAVAEAHAAALERRLPNGELILLENLHPLDTSAGGDVAPGGACPFLGQEAWVAADGRFDPCCAPDAERRSLGDFGNLHERGLMDIWRSVAYRQLTTTYASRALCQGCNMRRPADG